MTTHSRRFMLQACAGLVAVPVASLFSPAMAQGQEIQADAFTAMSQDPRFTTFVQLISSGGLQAAARASTPYTLFAPTDQALAGFSQLRDEFLGYMQGGGKFDAFPDTSRTVRVVRSWAVRGKHLPAEFEGKVTNLQSVQDTALTVDGTKMPMTVTWTSTVVGKRLMSTLGTPMITMNAVIYPEDTIAPAG